MLKTRIIPILTFNGFGLVKTKKFTSPRMVGNPVQAARVYNSRGVDELAFIDIMASRQKRKINKNLVSDVIKECFMPVAIGGGIETLNDINDLLNIGADKVIIKSKALTDTVFIKEAVKFFGSQCITIAVDAYKLNDEYKILNPEGIDIGLEEFLRSMDACEVGEFIVTSVDNDGVMNGFDCDLINLALRFTSSPIIANGGCGTPEHCCKLLKQTGVNGIGASSIFHFTQYTPLDIKKSIQMMGAPVRV